MEFTSTLEKRALEAQSLEAFNKLSLFAIKEAVAQLLELIGREGIFTQYTRHDISHINKLLEMLEWIIPSSTMSQMTSADCLMTALAVYFHDLGMLVTRQEFERRGESPGFLQFRSAAFDGDPGKDYAGKLARMPVEESERFLYQEFVRQHHAERIKAWIVGKNPKSLGVADGAAEEVEKLLAGMHERFRRDLALVCESHHLSDLDNFDKYKTSQPYGADVQEAANLQYSAILLRTADLLHVTKDRSPSLAFRMINPTDPKSIEEWHKQMAVTTVRSKPSLDKEGNVDPSAVRDTLEVHGFFTEPEGFFALTSYLGYARKELRKSNQWVQLAQRKKGVSYAFPWKEIDDSGLEARGFVNRQFEFSLDQAKILDLLTGHTLYNDSTVVLRELLQNSLDAIRVQWEDRSGYISEGRVKVNWNTADRILTIEDNGTGMTQRVIDEHFLKVGSSLYQDDQFRKLHPNFSAISRFGIGVLSAFMISDEIEVVTSHSEEPQGRKLSLRSLHGKYLIRLIDKDSSDLPPLIVPHGTQVKLRVRSSASLDDLPNIVRRWIVFPRCRVEIAIDDLPPTLVGFAEPKDAIISELTEGGLLKGADVASMADRGIKVEQRTKDGVTLAYALQWSEYFREWQLTSRTFRSQDRRPMVGTCIEGVRVDFSTPGYNGKGLLAIANASGPNAPKTNVARSGLEKTAELKSLLDKLYGLYCEQVKDEVNNLQKNQTFSLTWAVSEAAWLIEPLFSSRFLGEDVSPIDEDALWEACAEIPSIPLEEGVSRIGVSPRQLSKYPSFWTVDSLLFASAEALIKEATGPVALSTLGGAVGGDALQLPTGPYISAGQGSAIMDRLTFRDHEPKRIIIHRDKRRVDIQWVSVADPRAWRIGVPARRESRNMLEHLFESARFQRQPQSLGQVYIGQGKVDIEGVKSEVAVRAKGRTFILPGSPYARYLLKLLDILDLDEETSASVSYFVALRALAYGSPIPQPPEFLRREIAEVSRYSPLDIDPQAQPELLDVLQSTDFSYFDPQLWSRAGS